MAAEKPTYQPPSIRRYAPFFAGSPSKLATLMQAVEPASGERTAASLTVPSWDRELDETAPEHEDR